MNNTLKKTINTTEKADGTVILTYEKTSAFTMAPREVLRKVVLSAVFIFIPLVFLVNSAVGALVGAVVAISVIAFLFKLYLTKSMALIVKPHEYLCFDSHTVPFSEIETVGTKSLSVETGTGFARVYIVSNGTQAFITPEVSPALANALCLKIKQLSGKPWT